MKTLSWLNLALGTLVVAAAIALDPPSAAFWSAFVAGGIVVLMEIFDEWAEANDLETWITGPEAVTVVAGLWLAAFPFFVSTGGPLFLWTMVLSGALLAVSAGMNVIWSAQLMEEPGS